MLPQKIILRGLEVLAGKVWESDRQLRVGRMSHFEIELDSNRISRQHAEILFTGERWIVRDMGSTNGTFLNGVRIGAAEEVLCEGDILLFAEMCVRVAEIVAPATLAKQLDEKLEIQNTVTDLTGAVVTFSANRELDAGETNRVFEKLLLIGRNLAAHLSLDAYLEAILWESAEIANAHFGAVIIKDQQGPCVVRAMISVGKGIGIQDLLDLGLGEWAISHEGSLLCRVKGAGAPTNQAGGDRESIILAKLHAEDRLLGVLCLGRSQEQPPFQECDLSLADALARGVALSIDSFERHAQSNRELLSQTLTALANLAYSGNAYARSRAGRVTQYALLIANELSISYEDRYLLTVGTPLIDIGMFTLPASLRNKKAPLSHRETLQMRSHVARGVEFLETIPALKALTPLIRSHHEHWDGSGYPDGLKDESIPLLARVVAVADAFETMTEPDPNSDVVALSIGQAFQELQSKSGTIYDQTCINALLRAKKPIEELFLERGSKLRTISKDEMQVTLNECLMPPEDSRKKPKSDEAEDSSD